MAEERAYFAPFCRGGPHAPVAHHYKLGEVKGRGECVCPCHHLHNKGNPWWSEVNPPQQENCLVCARPMDDHSEDDQARCGRVLLDAVRNQIDPPESVGGEP